MINKPKDRLTQIWSAAREIYFDDSSNVLNLNSFIASSDENERNLIQRIGLVLSAKEAYDHQFEHPASHTFDYWMRAQEGSAKEAAQIIYDYVTEKDKSPRTMMFNLHSAAQEELVDKISSVYP